ncbi:acyl carrier protein [Neomegalonema sp.]|uniref:acyl carrier protein n=1 Tax=Neomegalonema sp. TaxID=2039713 RepID=UPI00262E26D9|nr:acyl carrier protein [Neomegalonema sp.]MDD2870018.1 acyl carrier protein [Neomegalonema sp.]
MTTYADVFPRLASIISEHFAYDIRKISDETTAPQVLGWDSLAHTIIIMKIEDDFEIEFPDDFIFKVRNVGELARKIVDLKE